MRKFSNSDFSVSFEKKQEMICLEIANGHKREIWNFTLTQKECQQISEILKFITGESAVALKVPNGNLIIEWYKTLTQENDLVFSWDLHEKHALLSDKHAYVVNYSFYNNSIYYRTRENQHGETLAFPDESAMISYMEKQIELHTQFKEKE